LSVSPEIADRDSRNAALTLSFALPGDVLLYLLLPLYADSFGVTLFEAGVLLAANRLIRIVGYGTVARLYGSRGARWACLVACVGSILSTLAYGLLSGFWLLLLARLVWGLSFATLNIANQALPTSASEGAAARSGRARSLVAIGPMLSLVAGALLAENLGPRVVFVVLALAALAAPVFAARLPDTPQVMHRSGPRISMPEPISIWSFSMGFALDGIFVFGLSLIAAQSLPQGAVIAAGAAMALRYVSEIVLSAPGGSLAQRVGPRRLLVGLSFATAASLTLLGAQGLLVWGAILLTVVLRALLQPLPAPVVAEAFPGPDRVPALARQATWRDIGAGAGPLAAGLLFPLVPAFAVFAGAGGLLALSTALLLRKRPSPTATPGT
jgi:MFS family permease